MGTEIKDGKLIRYDGDLQHFTVPEDVTEIAELAFSGANGLISIEIPDSVMTIGNYAFLNCYSLQNIRMPVRISRIGSGLFQNCWQLREIVLPEGLVTLGGDMLESCHALRSVYLPDSLKKIARSAFNTCRSLREIHISPDRMDVLPAPIRNIAVLTYMSTHDGSEACEAVDEYAKAKQRLLIDLAVNRRDTDAVRYMLVRGIADPETMLAYLDKAAATSRVEITALLLEYSRGMESDPVLSGDPFA